MKYIIRFTLGIFLLTLVTNCEVDDICTETVLTPKLIVKFYDNDDLTLPKKVTGIYVWAEGKDSLYEDATADSLLLPLNNLTNTTKYLLSTGNQIDTLLVSYDKEDIFVSRSCGYKTNFSLPANPSITQHWINGISMNETPQPVVNQNKAHVKIYH